MFVVYGVVGMGVAGVGMYMESRCLRADVRPPEAMSIRGPEFVSPVTFRCWYDTAGWRTGRDTWPLRWSLGVAAVGVATLAVGWVATSRLEQGPGTGNGRTPEDSRPS